MSKKGNEIHVKDTSLEFPWLKHYENGVPYTIDPTIYSSLVSMFEEGFNNYSARPCYTNFGTTLTYHQIDELSQAFAGFLQKKCELVPGERMAILLPNIMQYPVAMFGALRAGLIVVNINPQYTSREMKFILRDSGAVSAIILANFAYKLQEILLDTFIKHVFVTEVGDLLGSIKGPLFNFSIKYIKKMIPPWEIAGAYHFKSVILGEYKKRFKRVSIQGNDVAFLQYTSGTTGRMKGVILTHHNMIANTLQASVWIQPFFQEKVVDAGIQGGIITALPLYHIYALMANCFIFFRFGIANILITNPRNMPSFIEALAKNHFITITGVNTLYKALLNEKKFLHVDFSHLKFALGGGMAMQEQVSRKWKEVTGAPLLEAYGLTECSPALTSNPMYLNEYNGCVGLPLPSTEIKICDPDGKELPYGEIGEIFAKGPQVMKGYWNQPELTQSILNKGWLRTGDLAIMDKSGFIRFIERKDDLINISGFMVNPNEVEAVISQMRQIREVAVVGVKSAEHGEIVKAFIVRKDPLLKEDEIIAHCYRELTPYKVPKQIEFRTNLPKTPMGKVLRRALRDAH